MQNDAHQEKGGGNGRGLVRTRTMGVRGNLSLVAILGDYGNGTLPVNCR